MLQIRGWRRFHKDIYARRAILAEIVRRIVSVTNPEQILLFGSGARNQMRRRSDLDLLIITATEVEDRRALARSIYANLFGIPVPVDIVIESADNVARARREAWTFLGNILRDGKCIYRATGDEPGSGAVRGPAFFGASRVRGM